MGSVRQVCPYGPDSNGLEGRKQHNCKHKETRDGIFSQGEGLSEEDESQNIEVFEDINNKDRGDIPRIEQQGELQEEEQQQQQPLGSIVRWERFLPVKSLKVLLVENDDSTRQLVSALLRNCSYEVTAVANGLQAWKILQDLTNHIDLVLTEVFMPGLCGITLLSKIMNHKTCKNVPVIMMSSNNSMGTVFKCLSKGAVDFLVKPIRKNELKNLWQHVWRRCHSSSGSGSESGIQTQKSVKSKGAADDSENNSGSNEDDNDSSDLNARDGSENGSGTQSSCTKRAVEVESPRRISAPDQPDPPDSTCAQVIHSNSETFCNGWVPPISANGEHQGQKEITDELMGKDLEIGMPGNEDMHCKKYPNEKACSKLTDVDADKLPESDQKNEGDPGLVSNNSSSSEERSNQAADLIGAIANTPHAQPATALVQPPNCLSKIQKCQEMDADASTVLPSLELSLKRLRSTADCGSASRIDRNVVRRSEQSAFSRYHKTATTNQAPTGDGGSCSPLENNSSEAVRTDSTNNMISSSNDAAAKQGSNGSSNGNDIRSTTKNPSTNNKMSNPNAALKQGSDGSSNNNDMGSTTKNAFAKPAPNKEKTAAACYGVQTTAICPVQVRASPSQQAAQDKIEEPSVAAAAAQGRGTQHQVQMQYHHHYYYHHHLRVHNMQLQQQQQQPPDHDDLPPNNLAAPQQCWPSNVFVGPVEGNAANYSTDGSNSGRNHGMNGHVENSSAAEPASMDKQSANGVTKQSRPGGGGGGGNGSGSGSGSGVDQVRFAQREAALKKFREKRKERNFGKKVRYLSRKRLAEQRPRVRGQFVRQSMREQDGLEER